MMSPRFLAGSLVLAGALLSSCAQGPEQAQAPSGQDQPPSSIVRMQAPESRSEALTSKLNLLRAQTFKHTMDVEHRNELYTSAYRHAAYLNSVNCATYQPTIGSAIEGTAVTPNSLWKDLLKEGVTPTDGYPFPALRTHTDLWGRVSAVTGGPSLLANATGSELYEGYIFNGNIWRTATAGYGTYFSQFRGFNLDAPTSGYSFDEVDNLWYSRFGRIMAMRASVRAVGFANPYDDGINPPWPVLNGRLRGVWNMVASRPEVAQLGYWPSNNTTNVIPYGLDSDIGGQHQYSGPPIHLTLPVAEPILVRPYTSLFVEFEKSAFDPTVIDPSTGAAVAQPTPRADIQKTFRVYSNLTDLTVGPATTTLSNTYAYNAVGTGASVVSNGLVKSIIPSYINSSTTTTTSTSPVPDGYSLVVFDPSVDLSLVRRGDSISLTIVNTGNAELPAHYNGTYTVIHNSAFLESTPPTTPLPPNSLAVSYINAEFLSGVDRKFHPFNLYFPVNSGAQVLPSMTTPVGETGNIASITSVSLPRVTTTVDSTSGVGLRDGELLIIPTEPLEPNSWYDVRIRAVTPSYRFEDASDPISNPSKLVHWQFKTNGAVPP